MPVFRVIVFLLFVISVGCSLSGSKEASEVRVSIQGNTEVLRQALAVELSASGWCQTLSGDDFGQQDWPNHSSSFATPKSGNLQIQFSLMNADSASLNSGSISLDIRRDWRWSIDFALLAQNPFDACFGCIEYQSFAVDSVFQHTAADSLFIIWGGNSISNPVIY